MIIIYPFGYSGFVLTEIIHDFDHLKIAEEYMKNDFSDCRMKYF